MTFFTYLLFPMADEEKKGAHKLKWKKGKQFETEQTSEPLQVFFKIFVRERTCIGMLFSVSMQT